MTQFPGVGSECLSHVCFYSNMKRQRRLENQNLKIKKSITFNTNQDLLELCKLDCNAKLLRSNF
jgi:hypothetical protein